MDTSVVFLLLMLFPILIWMIWEYLDWSNDIFKVTQDEIMDLDRKPFGKEERRVALIENILSTEYERVGFTGYLLNYGTVYISVGGTKLAFEDVLDPAGVQSDINRRRMARIAKKNEDTANMDRERIANWLVSYHDNLDEIDVALEKKKEAENQKKMNEEK